MEKSYPTYLYEKRLKDDGHFHIAGVDEAGRGPGAGPVVAAAVRIPSEFSLMLLGGRVNDSKQMTEKQREEMFDIIKETCDYGIGTIDNNIIDAINILEATKLAMLSAIHQLDKVAFLLVDGPVCLNTPIHQDQIIKGDSKSISIAAASIIAKVSRDRLMKELHKKFPIYGWDTNKGYLTKAHIKAIKKYGPSVYHRISFRKVGR